MTNPNPLLDEADRERVAPPCVLVVFGASGDLAARKLLPALARLASRHALPSSFSVVGVARSELSDDEFRDRARKAAPDAGPAWEELCGSFRFVAGEYDHPDTFARLHEALDTLDRERGTAANRVH